jgi:hypothetical protein
MRADIHDGQEHKRSTHGPDTEAQDQSSPSVTFGLQHTAGPYRWVTRKGSNLGSRWNIRWGRPPFYFIRMSSANTVAQPATRSANANVDLRIGASLVDEGFRLANNRAFVSADFPPTDPDQLLQQRLRFLQITGVEAFSKPAVDRSGKLASLVRAAKAAKVDPDLMGGERSCGPIYRAV